MAGGKRLRSTSSAWTGMARLITGPAPSTVSLIAKICAHLRPFCRAIGRPSVDPELMIRVLLIGSCRGIRSGRRRARDVHLSLAYRWFCRLGREGLVGGEGFPGPKSLRSPHSDPVLFKPCLGGEPKLAAI